MTHRHGISIVARAKAGGFTLLEVLIALGITAIGLLGVAKMQALAYSSTGTAGSRSLVAFHTASLASLMRANRTYWSGNGPSSWATPYTLTITIAGGVITLSDLNGTAATSTFANNYCAVGGGGAPCSNSTTLAANDLHMWADGLNKLIPSGNSKTFINCPAGVTPISCTIQVTWNENTVGINKQSASGTVSREYTLYMEP